MREGIERYTEGLAVRAQAADRTHRTLAHARAKAGGLPLHVDLRELWPKLDVPERQRLLGAAFDCIILHSGRALPIAARTLFIPRGEAPDDLPRRGRRVPLRPFPWPLDGPVPLGEASPQDLEERPVDG
jgi:hypothetical protein